MRDPRVDPMKGDVLALNGTRRTVLERKGKTIHYRHDHAQPLVMSLETWVRFWKRPITKGATILERGDQS